MGSVSDDPTGCRPSYEGDEPGKRPLRRLAELGTLGGVLLNGLLEPEQFTTNLGTQYLSPQRLDGPRQLSRVAPQTLDEGHSVRPGQAVELALPV